MAIQKHTKTIAIAGSDPRQERSVRKARAIDTGHRQHQPIVATAIEKVRRAATSSVSRSRGRGTHERFPRGYPAGVPTTPGWVNTARGVASMGVTSMTWPGSPAAQ